MRESDDQGTKPARELGQNRLARTEREYVRDEDHRGFPTRKNMLPSRYHTVSGRGKPGVGYRPSYIFGRGTPRCPYKEGMRTAPQEVSVEPRAGKVWLETSVGKPPGRSKVWKPSVRRGRHQQVTTCNIGVKGWGAELTLDRVVGWSWCLVARQLTNWGPEASLSWALRTPKHNLQ